MNIILFEAAETQRLLPHDDPRAQHVVDVLRCHAGDTFDVGLIDGARGKATLVAVEPVGLRLEFAWGEPSPALDPVTLVIGMPRPQTARKVLEEVTALGVEAMHFVVTQRGEPNYALSKLWSSGEWRRHVIAGTEQAFSTRLPAVGYGRALAAVLADLPAKGSRLALDNYEAAGSLSSAGLAAPMVLALGPERGWSEAERTLLREGGFELVHLGERVLRVETACVAAVAVVKSRLGLM